MTHTVASAFLLKGGNFMNNVISKAFSKGFVIKLVWMLIAINGLCACSQQLQDNVALPSESAIVEPFTEESVPSSLEQVTTVPSETPIQETELSSFESEISVEGSASQVDITLITQDNSLQKEEFSKDMLVHFIDVGQGDSIFVELPNEQTMLIDAGEWQTAPQVINYIYGLGYSSLDYVIATHPHSDHIGGMPEVLNTFQVNNFYISPASHTTKTYENMLEKSTKANNVGIVGTGDVIINDHGLSVEVVAPNKNAGFDNLNNASVVIKLTYIDKTFLFTGDAEKEEEDLIRSNIKADVLKVGHHGSDTSTSENFLKKVEPQYAVISVGQGNDYGHPTDKVLNRIKNKNIAIYRTDLSGTIVFKTNGHDLQIFEEKDPSNDNAENTTTGSNNESEKSFYVLNTRSKKIHIPSCSAVDKMSEDNKKVVDDITGLEEEGYTFCGICH